MRKPKEGDPNAEQQLLPGTGDQPPVDPLNGGAANGEGTAGTASASLELPSALINVVLLKNIRRQDRVWKKGEKLPVSEDEARVLIGAKLARLPE
ncbi:hypothetical protein [Cohnella boryungensis]|uniref:Uncharacterized protein n=1 Tax=Cohnella boryungensis TaxID=768479 RepID=A0ABV8SFQ4_9BACL